MVISRRKRGPLTSGALALALALGAACGPSEQDCQQLCDWAAQACTDNSSCMDDCLDASADDVSYALQQCPGSKPSTCKSANCCLRFTYAEYYWQTNCYAN